MIDLLKNAHSLLPGLWKHRYWGAATAALIGAAGIAATVLLPGNYEATARAYFDTQSILKPLMEGMTVQPNFEQQVQMMARTLVSRPTLEKIVAATGLDARAKTEKDREALLQSLSKDIRFRPAGGTNHYSIEYRSQSQESALKVVSTLLTLFVDATRSDQQRDTRQALAFIDEEILKSQQTLQATENALKDFKIRHIDVMPNLAQDYVARSADAQKEVQVARLEYRQSVNSRNAIRERLATVPEFNLTTDGTRVIGPRESTETERRLEATRKRLDDLLVRYTDAHPEVIHTRQTIEELETERRNELRNPPRVVDPANVVKVPNKLYQDLSVSLADAEARVASNAARVADAEARVVQARQMALSIPKVEAEYIQLNRDYQSNKQNYEKLLSRRDAARLAGSMESAGAREFRVVDPPRVSPRPVSPNRPLLLMATLLASVAAGLVVAFLKDQFAPTFFDPAALRRASSAPLFGVVSRFRDAAAQRRERRSVWRFAALSTAYALLFAVLIVLFALGGRDRHSPESPVTAYNPGSALPASPPWSTVPVSGPAPPPATVAATPAPISH